MGVLFKYRNALSSKDFNQRFADVLGRSILSGFYVEKGTGDYDLSITSGQDSESLLIMRNGARIEETNTLQNVITLTANTYTVNRVDTIYAKYVHGTKDATVEYIAVEGNSAGEAAFAESEETHTILGYVSLPPGATLSTATFSFPTRGLHLPDVANEVEFLERPTFSKGVVLTDPVDGNDAVSKSYVESLSLSGNETFPYAQVVSSVYNAVGRAFEEVEYKRNDGTTFLRSRVSAQNANGRFETVSLTRFGADGLTPVGEETWALTYDGNGNLLSKKRV